MENGNVLKSPFTAIGAGKAGGGGKGLRKIKLPRSLYYTQAAEWIKIKDNPKAMVAENQWDGQVICGGFLWELYGNKAYCYSLEDGSLIETVSLDCRGV